ncbi:MAG: NTP transferase domain-containing protein [Clostridium sp.]|nr:NTP transferase domain-containing protein [Clostridium sp.]
MRTGAVIIAAGHKSSVSPFQPMLPIGDSTVIRRIIITLKRAGADPVVVVTGARGDEVEKHIAGLGVICLRNKEYEHVQMYDSICKGLNYIEDLCDRVFILPAKFPMFLPVTIERMMGSGREIVCPVFEGRRGHPVLVAGSVIPFLLDYKGERGLRGAVRQLEKRVSAEEILVEDQGIILSVETDEDLEYGELPFKRLDIYPQVQLTLERDSGFFGPSVAQFLTLIDHTGSMQTACRQMHMSYTKGWKTLKEAERELGYPLLVTRSGGAEGGFSQLTPKAREFLRAYLTMEKELKERARELYNRYFKGEKEGEHETII